MVMLKGWRYVAFVSSIVCGIGVALYPIIIDPILNTDKYKKERERLWSSSNSTAVQSGSS